MTTQNGPVSAATQTTGPKKSATAKSLASVVEGTAAVSSARPFTPDGARDPFAEVISIKPGRETRYLTVRCPHCGRPHRHGLGWDHDEPVTHRLAHCHGGRRPAGGYYVAIPASAAAMRRPGRKTGGGAQ
jgi:hypothetical protein